MTGPSDNYKWWVLATVGLGTYMSALDSSIVNTILPLIQKSLQSSLASTAWVMMGYLLTVSALLLTFGRLGDIMGHKGIYNLGFIIFTAGSVLAGASGRIATVISARVIQAVGGAMLLSMSPAILTKSFPPTERGRALGMQGTLTYLGLTTGPSLGGWLATHLGWGWVFFINLPIGIIGTYLAYRIIRPDRHPPGSRASDLEASRPGSPVAEVSDRQAFDLPGALTFGAGLALVLLGISKGPEWGWWSQKTVISIIVGVALLGYFVYLEKSVRFPLMDLALFQNRVFAASTASAVLNYICLFFVMFLLPYYLVDGRGYSAVRAGEILTAMPITMAVTTPFSGILSDKVGSRPPATAGMILIAAGVGLLGGLHFGSPDSSIALRLVVVGLGVGLFASPNNSAVMGSAPKTRQGVASAVLGASRNVGMVVGVALAEAVFNTRIAGYRAARLPEPEAFLGAFRETMLVGMAVAILGGILSFVRGRGRK